MAVGADPTREGETRVWLPYAQMKTTPAPIVVERSEGTRFHLRDGRVLVDGISNWWTACHGHSHPWILERVEEQLRALPHVMLGGLIAEPTTRLADRLAALLPGSLGRVFFSESGSVSVEVGLKIALQYWIHRGHPERRRFVSFYGAYHGDTFATMSVCDPEEGMHTLFRGAFPEQILATLPDTPERVRGFDALLAARRREIAAVVLEPLAQCAGGMRFHRPETLREVADACARHGIPLFPLLLHRCVITRMYPLQHRSLVLVHNLLSLTLQLLFRPLLRHLIVLTRNRPRVLVLPLLVTAQFGWDLRLGYVVA